MQTNLDPVAETGLQFFGKMTASISHEIKNVLAIINENGGLLEDLALMAVRGAAIEPQRLETISRVIMKQVGRADVIVKNMNRLAHSVDDSIKTIDLNDLLELLLALSNRLAAMRGVAVQVKSKPYPLKIKTSPFFLMNLLWACLDFAMDATGEDKIVELVPQKTEDGKLIFFKHLGELASAALKPFPADHENGLIELLGAELEINTANKEIVVRFVEDIEKD